METSNNSDAFDITRLSDYLLQHAQQQVHLPIDVQQFHDRLTPSYMVTDYKGFKFLLRKQAIGELASVSRIDREFHSLQDQINLGKMPVPRVALLCTDKTVLGSDFYVTDYTGSQMLENPVLDASRNNEHSL